MKDLTKLLLFCFAVVLFSCQEDDTKVTNLEQSKNDRITTINFNQLSEKINSNSKLIQKIKEKGFKEQDNTLFNKYGSSDFIFDLDSIYQYVDGDYQSFTIQAVKADSIDLTKSYALVVEIIEELVQANMYEFNINEEGKPALADIWPFEGDLASITNKMECKCVAITFKWPCVCHNNHAVGGCTHPASETYTSCDCGGSNNGTGGNYGTPPNNPSTGGGSNSSNPNPVIVWEDRFQVWQYLRQSMSWSMGSAESTYIRNNTSILYKLAFLLFEQGNTQENRLFIDVIVQKLLSGQITEEEAINQISIRVNDYVITKGIEDEPCLIDIFNDLGGSKIWTQYLNNFIPNASIANLEFKNDDNYGNKEPLYKPTSQAHTTYSFSNNTIDIVFNTDASTEGYIYRYPDIFRVVIFAHEMMHAEMYRKMLDAMEAAYPNQNNLNWSDFTIIEFKNFINSLENKYKGIFDFYTRYQFDTETPSEPQHNLMASYYRDTIKEILSDYAPQLNNQQLEALSWMGLMEAEIVAWTNLSPEAQENIEEIFNNTYYDYYNQNSCNN